MDEELGQLSDHVARTCAKQGVELVKGEAREVASRMAREGFSAKTLLTHGRIVAFLQEVRSAPVGFSDRYAAVESALAEASVGGMEFFRPDQPGMGVAVRFAVVAEMDGAKVTARVVVALGEMPIFAEAAASADIAELREALATEVTPMAETARRSLEECVATFSRDADAFLRSQGGDWEKLAFVKALQAVVEKALAQRRFGVRSGPTRLARTLRELFDHVLSRHSSSLAGIRFQRSAGYDDYVGMFSTARELGRKLVLIVGPTNSGKTHEALEIAAKAKTSRILSPLRLLAMEHYETLLAKGLRAGMVTGEEVLGEPDADHVAQTIETASTYDVVDVAVIDEIQMLADKDRGWAWTEALIGIPARTVVMTGSLDTVDMVTRIAARTGEKLEVRRLSRKNPLHAMPGAVMMEDIRKGDALISFSRRGLFELREMATRLGLSVATVYGSLSPEVRRAEAKRFREGEVDVLVATDAIGMGLNIGPLARVVFSTLSKFDGTETRWLTDSEIRQIAGRAGRYGHGKDGLAAVLDGNSPRRLAGALAVDPHPLSREKLYVRPTMRSITIGEEEFKSSRFLPLFEQVAANLVRGSDIIELSDLSATRVVAKLLDGLRLSVKEAFHYSVAPVEQDSDSAMRDLKEWATVHAEGRHVPAPSYSPRTLESLELAGKMMTLYLWLSRKFPDVYTEREEVLARRVEINALIEQDLLSTSQAKVAKREAGKGRRKKVAAAAE